VVVHGNGEDFLGPILTDDIIIKAAFKFYGRQESAFLAYFIHGLVGHDFVAQGDALVTNTGFVRTFDQAFDLIVAFVAKGAAQAVTCVLG
jgi:hypothetical protein